MKDLAGQIFGRLKPLNHIGKGKWECLCDCGNITTAYSGHLRAGSTKSCGCIVKAQGPRKNFLSEKQRFGRWVTISYVGNGCWRCICDCGTEKNIDSSSLIKGISTSCGCWAIEKTKIRNRTHGHSINYKTTPEFKAWWRMLARCYDKNNEAYPDYGGRGIMVCKEWIESFEPFFNYIGLRPSPNHSLDRFPDNDGNYEPGNVRWATKKEQALNRRSNVILEYNSIKNHLTEWAKEFDVSHTTLSSFLKRNNNDMSIAYNHYKKNK